MTEDPASDNPQRRPLLLGAAALAVVAVTVLVAVLLGSGGDDSRREGLAAPTSTSTGAQCADASAGGREMTIALRTTVTL